MRPEFESELFPELWLVLDDDEEDPEDELLLLSSFVLLLELELDVVV